MLKASSLEAPDFRHVVGQEFSREKLDIYRADFPFGFQLDCSEPTTVAPSAGRMANQVIPEQKSGVRRWAFLGGQHLICHPSRRHRDLGCKELEALWT
jgi:hypothetical protein